MSVVNFELIFQLVLDTILILLEQILATDVNPRVALEKFFTKPLVETLFIIVLYAGAFWCNTVHCCCYCLGLKKTTTFMPSDLLFVKV